MAWAVRAQLSQLQSLARLRHLAQVKAAIHEESIWLTGDAIDEATLGELWTIPHAECFQIRPPDTLVPMGSLVPTETLPDLNWSTLAELIKLELPAAGLSSEQRPSVSLSVISSTNEIPANVLITDFKTWHDYAITAPEIRLNRLRFAVSHQELVIIHGTPLPSIPGRHWYEQNGICLPCGFEVSPVNDPEVLHHLLALNPGDLAIINRQAKVTIIPSENVTKATRAAVRETANNL